MSDKVSPRIAKVENYRGFNLTVEILGVARFGYIITGGKLQSRITTDAPLESAQRALDQAKMFVDEHLA